MRVLIELEIDAESTTQAAQDAWAIVGKLDRAGLIDDGTVLKVEE